MAEQLDFIAERQRYRNFCGRQDVLDEIARLVTRAARKGGYVLVTGGPGTGKSALMCKYLDLLEASRGDRVMPHHFFRRAEAAWAQPISAMNSMAALIEGMYPEQRDGNDNKSVDRLSSLLKRISSANSVTATEPLVLTIDALDEAQETGGDNQLSRVLPSRPPPGVVIVCASRPHDPPLVSGAALIDLASDRWQSSNDKTCQEYLRLYATEPALPPPFIDEAVRRGEGNLLYIVCLLSWLKGPPPREPSIDILPRGLTGYMEQLWQGVMALPDKERELARQGLGLLCAAREPLPLPLLADLLHWPDEEADEAFRKATQTFLYRDDSEHALRPFHESFREFVLQQLEREDEKLLIKLHTTLANELSPWPLPAANTAHGRFLRHYALRHRLHHLIAAGDWEAARKLGSDLDYLVLKCHKHGPRSLEGDCTLALKYVKDPAQRTLWTLFEQALANDRHRLLQDPTTLPSLLYTRLRCLGWDVRTIENTLHPAERLPRLRLRHAPQHLSGGWILTLAGHRGAVSCCQFSADGSFIVSGSDDHTIRVWDAQTGHETATLRGHQQPIEDLLVGAHGERVLSYDGAKFRLWDLTTAEELENQVGTCRVWAITSNGQLLLADYETEYHSDEDTEDGTPPPTYGEEIDASRYDVLTGNLLESSTLHTGLVSGLSAGKDYFVGVRKDGSGGTLWRSDNFQPALELHNLPSDLMPNCEATPEGSLLIVGEYQRTVRGIDLKTGEQIFQIEAYGMVFFRLFPDGDRVLIGMESGDLNIYEIPTEKLLYTLRGPGAPADCSISADGKRAVSAHADGTLRVWDLAGLAQSAPSEEAAKKPSNLHKEIWSCSISDDEKRCATVSSADSIQIWDLVSGEQRTVVPIVQKPQSELQGLPPEEGLNLSFLCDWLPDGKELLWARGNSVKIFETENFKPLFDFELYNAGTFLRVFARCGRALYDICADRLSRHMLDATFADSETVTRIPDIGMPSPEDVDSVVTAFAATKNDLVIYGQQSIYTPQGNTLSVFQPQTQWLLFNLKDRSATIDIFVSEDDQSFLALSAGGAYVTRDFESYTPSLPFHGPAISSTQMSHFVLAGRDAATPQGKLFTTCNDSIIAWDIQNRLMLECCYGTYDFRCVAASKNVVCAGDERGNLWIFDHHEAAQNAPRPIGNRHAMTVGVTAFADAQLPPLPFAKNDAHEIETVLGAHGYSVMAMYDDSSNGVMPTRENIYKGLLAFKLQPDDLLVVHFSCHGAIVDGRVLLLVHDTEWTDPQRAGATGVFLDHVIALMKRSGAKNLVLLLDACHTGLDAAAVASPLADAAQSGVAVLAGSMSQEEALDREERQMGAFTSFIVDAIKMPEHDGEGYGADAGECPKGYVTLDDLACFVISGVTDWSRNKSRKGQSPTAHITGYEQLVIAPKVGSGS